MLWISCSSLVLEWRGQEVRALPAHQIGANHRTPELLRQNFNEPRLLAGFDSIREGLHAMMHNIMALLSMAMRYLTTKPSKNFKLALDCHQRVCHQTAGKSLRMRADDTHLVTSANFRLYMDSIQSICALFNIKES